MTRHVAVMIVVSCSHAAGHCYPFNNMYLKATRLQFHSSSFGTPTGQTLLRDMNR